jgi:2-polyprenyl-3-methyl-5-hydroxy-6-metoxy-1,4-benzoquinol methylase
MQQNQTIVPEFKDTCYRRYRAELGTRYEGEEGNPFLLRLLRTHVPNDRGTRICDLGCGAGMLLRMLQNRGYLNVEGVDCSPFQVERRVSASVQLGDAFRYLQTKVNTCLDVVIAYDVIEHLQRGELLRLASEVHRVLAPGGRWVIHTPNAAGLFGSRVRYADLTHDSAFTFESLRQLHEIAGFASIRVYEDKPNVHGAFSAIRRLIWELARVPFLLVWTAETGDWRNCILSQNMTAVFYR